MRGPVGSAILYAQWMLDSIAELPTPLRVTEAEKRQAAVIAFAEHLRDSLDDLLDDVLRPLLCRAYEAGIDPHQYIPGRLSFYLAVSKITNGGK